MNIGNACWQLTKLCKEKTQQDWFLIIFVHFHTFRVNTVKAVVHEQLSV